MESLSITEFLDCLYPDEKEIFHSLVAASLSSNTLNASYNETIASNAIKQARTTIIQLGYGLPRYLKRYSAPLGKEGVLAKIDELKTNGLISEKMANILREDHV